MTNEEAVTYGNELIQCSAGRLREFAELATRALRSPSPGAEAMREAAIEAHRHLQTWLDADACDCEFETGHVCGRVQIAATVKRLEAAIRAIPAREVPEECHDSSDAVTGGGDK